MRSADIEVAMVLSDLIEHGATIIPAVRKEPLLVGAAMSRTPWT